METQVLLDDVLTSRLPIFIFGSTGSGKSTLGRYLFERLKTLYPDMPVAWINPLEDRDSEPIDRWNGFSLVVDEFAYLSENSKQQLAALIRSRIESQETPTIVLGASPLWTSYRLTIEESQKLTRIWLGYGNARLMLEQQLRLPVEDKQRLLSNLDAQCNAVRAIGERFQNFGLLITPSKPPTLLSLEGFMMGLGATHCQC